MLRHLTQRFRTSSPQGSGVQAFLDSLVANRLMITDGRNYLSLAVQNRGALSNDTFADKSLCRRPDGNSEMQYLTTQTVECV